ncbi:spore coat protein [Clostridium formicaceticum]|uniref:Coat F domain protein n=1 Tax=Clostridium formicaceticum TaxID=1497 RepID=A0AAC9RJC3_9CLOT|nr:spore coat protein [Clostridium formicaceticum]AOY76158.1 spore coat protein [Clostridium formicaceticum]ARE86530.1 Coat F domain protein [Clostridium formicaceticum]
MQEKDMVNDILSMTKAGMTEYTRAIGEASDQGLRQTLQQMRNGDEQFQYSLYQIAEQKGYYQSAQSASQQELQQVKSQLTQGMNNMQ